MTIAVYWDVKQQTKPKTKGIEGSIDLVQIIDKAMSDHDLYYLS